MDPFEEAFPRAHADPPVPLGGDMHSPFEFSLPPPPPAPSSRSRWDLSPAPPRDVDATIDLDLTAFMSAEEGEPSPEEGAGRMFAPASSYEEPQDDSPQPSYGSEDGGATCSSADTLAASSNEAQPYVNAHESHASEDTRPSYSTADYASSSNRAPSFDELQAPDAHENAEEHARGSTAPSFHTQQSYNPNSLELEAAARAVLVASPERGGSGNGGIGFISPSAFVHNEEAECAGDDPLEGVLSEEEEESYRRAVSSPPRMQSSNTGAAAALDLLSHPQALAAAQVMVGAARLSFDYTVDLANKGSAEFIDKVMPVLVATARTTAALSAEALSGSVMPSVNAAVQCTLDQMSGTVVPGMVQQAKAVQRWLVQRVHLSAPPHPSQMAAAHGPGSGGRNIGAEGHDLTATINLIEQALRQQEAEEEAQAQAQAQAALVDSATPPPPPLPSASSSSSSSSATPPPPSTPLPLPPADATASFLSGQPVLLFDTHFSLLTEKEKNKLKLFLAEIKRARSQQQQQQSHPAQPPQTPPQTPPQQPHPPSPQLHLLAP